MANRFSFESTNLGFLEDLRPQIPEASASTPQVLPQNKTDIIGKILGFAKSQFQKSQEALATPIPGTEKLREGGIAVDPTGMLGVKRVGGEIVKKAPKVVETIKGIIKPIKAPKIAQISPKIAPELQPLAQEARKYKSAEEFQTAMRQKATTEISGRGKTEPYIKIGKDVYSKNKLENLGVKSFQDFYNQAVGKAALPSPIKEAPDVLKTEIPTGGGVMGISQQLPEGIEKITKRGVQITKEFANYARGLKDLGPIEFKPTSLLDPVRAAEKLDQSQAGLLKKTLIEPVVKADDELIKDAQSYTKRVSEFAGGIKSGSPVDQLIRRYGERDVYPEAFTKEDATKITPQIDKAVDGFRNIYDELLVRLNEARLKVGQKEIPKRKDYFTHSEELGTLINIFGDVNNIPGDMLRAAPFTKPNAPFFKFALPRYFSKSTAGAVEGFERYLQGALPTIHYADPIVNLRGHIPFLPPRASAYFQDFTNDLARKKSQLDRPIPDVVLKLADKFRGLTSKGSILGNLSTAFLQPSSIASTISRAGVVNTIRAIPETFTNTGIELAEKYSKVLRARTYDPDINPTTLNKVEKVLGWAVQTMDRVVVRNSFLANLKYAVNNKKLPFEEAVKYADELASKTQATNRKIFQPPFLRSKVGGTLGQLQTFTVNLYNQVRRDIPLMAKEQGKLEAFKAALYLGISAVAINKLYEEAGLAEPYNLTTFVPFVGQARYGEPTPALTGVAGVAQVVFGEGEKRKEGIERLKRFATTLVPGGRQAVKTLKGIKAIQEGGSRTPTGKLRYPIKGTAEELRALIFGPTQTKAARKFYENKSEKKTNRFSL